MSWPLREAIELLTGRKTPRSVQDHNCTPRWIEATAVENGVLHERELYSRQVYSHCGKSGCWADYRLAYEPLGEAFADFEIEFVLNDSVKTAMARARDWYERLRYNDIAWRARLHIGPHVITETSQPLNAFLLRYKDSLRLLPVWQWCTKVYAMLRLRLGADKLVADLIVALAVCNTDPHAALLMYHRAPVVLRELICNMQIDSVRIPLLMDVCLPQLHPATPLSRTVVEVDFASTDADVERAGFSSQQRPRLHYTASPMMGNDYTGEFCRLIAQFESIFVTVVRDRFSETLPFGCIGSCILVHMIDATLLTCRLNWCDRNIPRSREFCAPQPINSTWGANWYCLPLAPHVTVESALHDTAWAEADTFDAYSTDHFIFAGTLAAFEPQAKMHIFWRRVNVLRVLDGCAATMFH